MPCLENGLAVVNDVCVYLYVYIYAPPPSFTPSTPKYINKRNYFQNDCTQIFTAIILIAKNQKKVHR